jgi:hypothetical protein
MPLETTANHSRVLRVEENMPALMHFFSVRDYWRELRRGRPGERFMARYEHARAAVKQRGPAQRIVMFVLAFVFLAIGVVLTFIPGPAVLFFFLAGGLLATESRFVARFMDSTEVLLRRAVKRIRSAWRRLPTIARVACAAVGACGSVAAAYLGYRLMVG